MFALVRAARLRYAALPVAFALGWAARAPAAPQVTTISALPAGAPSSCVDAAAMEANQKLVAELVDHHHARATAEHAVREVEAKLAAATKARAVPAQLAPAREEWARMARDRTVRLRRPCSTWDAGRRIGTGRSRFATGSGEIRRRAALAGFEEGELEALAQAYAAASTRTWRTMRAACEEGPFFAQAMAESEGSSDADRVAICQASLLPDDAATHGAVQRVAEARAAGRGVPGHSPAERVAFAVSESTDVLFEEMKHALGEEKAMRAIDFGVLCTDESVFTAPPSE